MFPPPLLKKLLVNSSTYIHTCMNTHTHTHTHTQRIAGDGGKGVGKLQLDSSGSEARRRRLHGAGVQYLKWSQLHGATEVQQMCNRCATEVQQRCNCVISPVSLTHTKMSLTCASSSSFSTSSSSSSPPIASTSHSLSFLRRRSST